MQLELEKPDTPIYVKHYQKGQISLPEKTYTHSLIFTPDRLINDNWPVTDCGNLNLESLALMLDSAYEVFLLGSGNVPAIPSQAVIQAFARIGKTLDFMDSSAACRTFNILANEGRRVIAGIIV